MSTEVFTIAYDGPALAAGVMDVRDLAPALMALGQVFDAANQELNGEVSKVRLEIRATTEGSFEIGLQLTHAWSGLVSFFSSPGPSAAANLVALVTGLGASGAGLFHLIRWLQGGSPDKVEPLDGGSFVKLTIRGETLIVPLQLMRLYRNIAVRAAVQKVVEEPLRREGIETFLVRKDKETIERVDKAEAAFFAKPGLPDEIVTDSVQRSAFSIVSLAFKEENKWRLHDGSSQINALIADEEFLARVDRNEIAFSKGDILICDVRVTQRRVGEGLQSEFVVKHVVEHRAAARQLPLPLSPGEPTNASGEAA